EEARPLALAVLDDRVRRVRAIGAAALDGAVAQRAAARPLEAALQEARVVERGPERPELRRAEERAPLAERRDGTVAAPDRGAVVVDGDEIGRAAAEAGALPELHDRPGLPDPRADLGRGEDLGLQRLGGADLAAGAGARIGEDGARGRRAGVRLLAARLLEDGAERDELIGPELRAALAGDGHMLPAGPGELPRLVDGHDVARALVAEELGGRLDPGTDAGQRHD